MVPSTRTRRVLCSITVRMYCGCPVSVTVSMKSHASSASAWLRRNAAQVVAVRSGAGLMPSSLRISQTVEAAILMPKVARGLSDRVSLPGRRLVTGCYVRAMPLV